MSSTFTLPELLEVVKDAYKCVEVRTIAAQIDGTIYNVVTLIQFSTSSPDECKENMRKRVDGRDLRADGPLRFAWRCLPATKWPEVAAQLAAGELRVRRLIASLGAAVELESFTSHIGDNFGYIRNPTPPYPMFLDSRSVFPGSMSTPLGQKLEGIRNDLAVRSQLNRSGFASFRELASVYLGAINNDPGVPSPVVILAPVPVMVSRIEIDAVDHRITARIHLHPKLMGNLWLRGDIIAGYQPGGSKRTLSFGEFKLGKENEAYADAEFELTSLDHYVQLRIVHNTLGIIHDPPPFPVRQAVPDGYLVPDVEGATASAPGADRIEMSADTSTSRAKAVQRVLEELAKITPLMKSDADYDNVRKQFPDSTTFKVCDCNPDLKRKLENIACHQQGVRFAQEIVAAKCGRAFNTVQKDWKTHKPRKAKA